MPILFAIHEGLEESTLYSPNEFLAQMQIHDGQNEVDSKYYKDINIPIF